MEQTSLKNDFDIETLTLKNVIDTVLASNKMRKIIGNIATFEMLDEFFTIFRG